MSVFVEAQIVSSVLMRIRQFAATYDFAILAYCFMPDHVHLVRRATSESSPLRTFMSQWKQWSGLDYRQRTRSFLWQPSYFDHVLRDDEETQRAVKYVLENPVRKGLVKDFRDYPFSGSDVYSAEELAEFRRERQG